AVPPRFASQTQFSSFLPPQSPIWLTPFISQRSVLPRPQLLSFDNHLDCLCFGGKMRLPDPPSSTNQSRISDFRAGSTTKLPLAPKWEKAGASPRRGRNPQV